MQRIVDDDAGSPREVIPLQYDRQAGVATRWIGSIATTAARYFQLQTDALAAAVHLGQLIASLIGAALFPGLLILILRRREIADAYREHASLPRLGA